jgi:hypothetical protein
MSRQVTLNTNDGLTQIGTTILQSDFPETPQVLIWKGRAFISGHSTATKATTRRRT